MQAKEAPEIKYTHITSRHKPFDLKLGEVWQYKDLILMFARRSFQVSYKQTVLGPLWLFINPLLTSVFQLLLFGKIAGLSTDGIPQILFYLSGNAVWGFFSGRVSSNSSTFTGNAGLFGKVYFPRLVIPIADVLSGMIRFCIQLLLMLVFYVFFLVRGDFAPNWVLFLLLPLIVVELGILGMGVGIIISSMTTKYRDLSVLVGFGLQLWMYASPVVYPIGAVSGWLRTLLLLNPVSAPLELFRYVLFGTGTVCGWSLLWSLFVTALVCFFGILIFNRVERTFIDTV